MSDAQTLYKKLHEISKKTELLSSMEQLLHWDQETYLPPLAIESRGEQLEELARRIHKEKTSPTFAKALAKLIDLETGKILVSGLSSKQEASLKLWRKDFLKEKKLPSPFVKKFAKVTTEATHVWAEARKNNTFSSFAPHLEKIVHLTKQKADILGYAKHPYDALVDFYEPDISTEDLTKLFDGLKTQLTSLLKEITAKKSPTYSFVTEEYAPEKQKQFSFVLLEAMGFPKGTYRLDESAHPFCIGPHMKDIRMTSTIHAKDLLSNIFAVLHEGGHGLYHTHLPEKEYGSPICASASFGIDESQSRFWETTIGCSYPFWEHFFPLLKRDFPEQLSSVSVQDFYQAVNLVQPSLIRIYADEVTYSLHILIRFEIEKGLLEGNLKVKDLPEIWRAKMQEYLGIAVPNDAQGCLQDIHWSSGYFGYFPTYSLGNLYAAQIFEAFEKKFPTWQELVKQGNLLFIRDWLRDNIHQYGREFSPKELIQKITGKPLSEKPFIDYLRKKYL